MTRLKRYSRNAVKAVLSASILILFTTGCNSSTAPTFKKETAASSIKDILKREYNLEVTTGLAGNALWIYYPAQDILEESKKNEAFRIERTDTKLIDGNITTVYSIKKTAPKEIDSSKFKKQIQDNTGNIWKILRRVLFSLDRSKESEPEFYRIVVADIKNGFEIINTSYYTDIKKVSYGIISGEEYGHRSPQEINVSEEIIGDKTGKHVVFKSISMGDFIAQQINHRIILKFATPEFDLRANVDIDKEIKKIPPLTIKIYDYQDFNFVELENLVSGYKIMLNKAAILGTPTERRF